MSTPTFTTMLTTKDLAARWKVSSGHLANLRSAGTGPAFRKFGTAVRYSLSDVERYEAEAFVPTLGQSVAA